MYADIFVTIALIMICIRTGYLWARLKKPFDIALKLVRYLVDAKSERVQAYLALAAERE